MPDPARFPLCHHIKDDGVRCGSPALRGKDLCYFHHRQARRPLPAYIPPLNNRASIQHALSQLMRAAFAGRVHDDRLRSMVYTLQVALTNLRDAERSVARSPSTQPATPTAKHAGESPASPREEGTSH